jgi:alanyl-tRNA synthetase
MTVMSSAAIRQAFLDYFKSHQHEIVPSSSLVPAQDPSLLFINAGMVQFKNTFLGLEPRPYSRAVSVQRCVRAGGKHNDLDQVGYTARHHTLFEMLGNFSFGDYFKREAIHHAWDFLTRVLNLPEARLWVTVYEQDDETASIWLDEMGVSPERFSRCGDDDNFWSMGETGPCGPCSEIFYDHGPSVPGGPPGSPEAEGDRYVEIWNVVFMQFNRDADGVLHPLEQPSVDTGMGLERIAAILQGVQNNYDIDVFQELKASIRALVAPDKHDALDNTSLNVIADHIRACVFLIADDVLPSNEGRGYVLRRIVRRAVRHGHRLNLPTPFLARLVDVVVQQMGDAYPLLQKKQGRIQHVLEQEEAQFEQTLEHGLLLLKQAVKTCSDKILSGDVAFKLYDTYGFPLDLTQDILREQGLTVDKAGFEVCMQKQRTLSQASQAFRADYAAMTPFTETSTFEGYTAHCFESMVLALRVGGKPVKTLTPGMQASLVLDATPFYAESGGQVGDKGELRAISGDAVFRVDDTQRVGQAIVHEGELIFGELLLQDRVFAEVDEARREATRLNHTATHLLHAALKQQFGEHVTQKGSLVDATRARFDVALERALTTAEWEAVEDRVNQEIRANQPVETTVMSMDEALEDGAVALFGEKYGETVRVLTMGDFSKELCGGTHARRTGDLGLFKITAEYGVARGVRRLEFVTGGYALNWMREKLACLSQASALLKTTAEELPEKLAEALDEAKQKTRALTEMKQRLTNDAGRALQAEFQDINGIDVLVKKLDGADTASLRRMLDALKASHDASVIVLVGVLDKKIHVLARVGKTLLVDGVPKAPLFVQAICGRGGGRDDMAQGGGVLPDDLDRRMADALALLQV